MYIEGGSIGDENARLVQQVSRLRLLCIGAPDFYKIERNLDITWLASLGP